CRARSRVPRRAGAIAPTARRPRPSARRSSSGGSRSPTSGPDPPSSRNLQAPALHDEAPGPIEREVELLRAEDRRRRLVDDGRAANVLPRAHPVTVVDLELLERAARREIG